MAGKYIAHAELDQKLDRLALDQASYEKKAKRLAGELDSKGLDLEITHPETWHRGHAEEGDSEEGSQLRVSIENQLRSEIDDMIHLGRVDEARLARRIEFARLRLQRSLDEAGLTLEDLNGGVGSHPATYAGTSRIDCELFPRVCRRWTEWHALRTELVERNLYLALINVERYAHTTAGRPDLIQEGAAALYRAVDGFDWRRGLLFRTYAVHWLNQAFRSYLYNFNATVRVPVYLQKAMRHVQQAIEKLGDPDASPAEIARVSGLGENLVCSALESMRSTRSLDAPMRDDEDSGGLRDTLRAASSEDGPYSTDLEDVSLQSGIHEALGRLSERERHVVALRFGIGHEREHTLAEVASELGVSLERVRQIQVRAITKMRSPSLRKAVDPYLNN
jgi:RNA polymerase primary sigma factor